MVRKFGTVCDVAVPGCLGFLAPCVLRKQKEQCNWSQRRYLLSSTFASPLHSVLLLLSLCCLRKWSLITHCDVMVNCKLITITANVSVMATFTLSTAPVKQSWMAYSMFFCTFSWTKLNLIRREIIKWFIDDNEINTLMLSDSRSNSAFMFRFGYWKAWNKNQERQVKWRQIHYDLLQIAASSPLLLQKRWWSTMSSTQDTSEWMFYTAVNARLPKEAGKLNPMQEITWYWVLFGHK